MIVVLPGTFGAIVRGLWSVCYNWGFFVTFGACVCRPSYFLGRLGRVLYIRGSFGDVCLIAFVIVCLV